MIRKIKPFSIIIAVCSISFAIVIGTIVAFCRSSLIHFGGYIDKDYFPAFGSFIANMVGILFSATSMILIYYTYLSQQKLVDEQSKVFDRDYVKYIDSIRPLIEIRFGVNHTKYDGTFLLEIKENSACEFEVANETVIPVELTPSVIHMPYFNKDNPLKFRYHRDQNTQFPNGIIGELKLRVRYEDYLHNRYEQTFTSALEHHIFVSSKPIKVVGMIEPVVLG